MNRGDIRVRAGLVPALAVASLRATARSHLSQRRGLLLPCAGRNKTSLYVLCDRSPAVPTCRIDTAGRVCYKRRAQRDFPDAANLERHAGPAGTTREQT